MPLEFLSLLCLSSYTDIPQWLLLGRICLINPIPKLLLVRMRKLTRAVGHRVDKICPSWKLEFKSFQFINFSQKPCTVQGSLWWSLSQRHHQRLMSEGSVRGTGCRCYGTFRSHRFSEGSPENRLLGVCTLFLRSALCLLPVCGWKYDQLLPASAALCACFLPPVGTIPLELWNRKQK